MTEDYSPKLIVWSFHKRLKKTLTTRTSSFLVDVVAGLNLTFGLYTKCLPKGSWTLNDMDWNTIQREISIQLGQSIFGTFFSKQIKNLNFTLNNAEGNKSLNFATKEPELDLWVH